MTEVGKWRLRNRDVGKQGGWRRNQQWGLVGRSAGRGNDKGEVRNRGRSGEAGEGEIGKRGRVTVGNPIGRRSGV